MADVVGIWDQHETDLFQKYRVSLTFTDWVMGGVPQKPDVIESWLRQRILGGDDEIRMQLLKTLEELDYELPMDATHEEIIDAVRIVAKQRNGNTFRRGEDGLFLAAYQVKAMLKESCNIQFAGERWGLTKKGPKNYLAERVFVDDYQIPLGRVEPDGTYLQIGKVNGPQGPRSTLTYVDYCDQPAVSFTVSSFNDCVTPDQWRQLLVLSQRLGLGALRSMNYGQFKVTGFERL